MEFIRALDNVPSSKELVKYFNGFRWSSCDCNRLRCDVKAVSNLFQQLLDGKQLCLGFCCQPFLGLPALILGAAVSSCPFIFLDEEKVGSGAYLALFETLQISWVVSDHTLTGAPFTLKRQIALCETELSVYYYVGLTHLSASVCSNYLYAVTTSGTTGSPKIVRVPSQSILPNVRDFSRRMGIGPDDVILLHTALTFDPSMVEFFLAVLNGASLVIVSGDVKMSRELLSEAIRDGHVTFYQTTPSLFRLWPAETKRSLLGSRSELKYLVLGGEPFPGESEVKLWEPGDKIQIYNTYGITEVSCWTTLKLVWPCSEWEHFVHGAVDIGEPLSDTLLQVRSHDSRGLYHLFIGSSVRVCAIQDETFPSNQDQIQPVFRATGDLFKMIDGQYYFSHRIDSTVKRLGKKFSLALVEEKARNLALNCAAVKNGSSDTCAILLFVEGGRSSSELQVKLESLKASLPNDHWPDRVEFVESLPITPHGKLDKPALLERARAESESINEKTLEELWCYFTLGSATRLSSDCKEKGFITSGGNSLNAVLFINSLSERGSHSCQELLVLLLKDASFVDCLAFFQETINGDTADVPRSLPERGDRSSQNEPVSLVTASYFHREVAAPTSFMALKGRVWPGMLCFPEVWNRKAVRVRPEWKIDLKKCVDASPLVVASSEESEDCMIIIGSHSGLVVVLDAFGEIKAETQLPDRVEASACMSNDTRSYYIGCYDGKLYNVRIKDGRVMWEFATEGMVKCTAVVDGGKIFFGSYDKHIYAVSEAGTMVWKREVGAVTVPVLIHKSTVIVGTLTAKIVFLNSDDGHEYFTLSVASPIFSNLQMTYFDEAARCLLACPVNGSLEWLSVDDAFTKVHSHHCPGTVFAAPVLVNDTDLIITSGTTLQYYQPPKRLWSRTFAQRIVATPFVANKRIVVVTVDGELALVDLNSGELSCSYRFPGEVFSSPVAVGAKIFVGCRDNYFHCVSVM